MTYEFIPIANRSKRFGPTKDAKVRESGWRGEGNGTVRRRRPKIRCFSIDDQTDVESANVDSAANEQKKHRTKLQGALRPKHTHIYKKRRKPFQYHHRHPT